MIIDFENNITIINSQECQAGFNELTIFYGFGPTPFGECLIGFSNRGVCYLSFLNGEDKIKHFALLKKQWKKAGFIENSSEAKKLINQIFYEVEQPIALVLKGTEFQIKVWRALINVKSGQTKTYADIAKLIDKPVAIRATASAIAKNNIAFLVPCHRIILKSGKIHKYRWGSNIKKMLLEYESKLKM